MLRSQRETHQLKRTVCRGRLWIRGLGSRPLPHYPGLRLQAGPADKLAGLYDTADEAAHRAVAAIRYPPGGLAGAEGHVIGTCRLAGRTAPALKPDRPDP